MSEQTIRSWQTPEWQKNREEFFKKNPWCIWHGEPVKATVPHHPQKLGSLSQTEYVSLKGCIPFCKECNWANMKKLKLCPVCKDNYFNPKRGKRKMCWNCFVKTDFGKVVADYYEKHPKELTLKKKNETSTEGRKMK